MEIYLHRDDLAKMIEFIDKVNPAGIYFSVDGKVIPQSGTVKITYDSSSGIGTIIKATCLHEYLPGKFGDLTISISDVDNW